VRLQLVVFDQPFVGDLLHLLNRFEQVRAQYLIPISPIEPLDVCVLIRLAGFDEAQGDAAVFRPVDLPSFFGPLMG
jgi:hypothetical protein